MKQTESWGNRFIMRALVFLCIVLITQGVQGWTTPPAYYTTEDYFSCQNKCGGSAWFCSCVNNCETYGSCCHDYSTYCSTTTEQPETSADPGLTTTDQPSCRYNCGYNMGSCSCSSSCQWNGNCCHDYHSYCGYLYTTIYPTSSQPSCKYNCGWHMGSCSCSSSCQRNGNCCHDYHSYCGYLYSTEPTTSQQSCENNCGSYLGSCSCQYSCQWNGNCCHDYYSYCEWTTEVPTSESEEEKKEPKGHNKA